MALQFVLSQEVIICTDTFVYIFRWDTSPNTQTEMICKLFDLEDYAGTYRETRNAYLKAANQLKLATGPYKAARDAYVAATATYTKSLYE